VAINHPNGQEAHGRMLSVISLATGIQTTKIQDTNPHDALIKMPSMLARTWRNWNPLVLLFGMYNRMEF
jgi:hypothetical protein